MSEVTPTGVEWVSLTFADVERLLAWYANGHSSGDDDSDERDAELAEYLRGELRARPA